MYSNDQVDTDDSASEVEHIEEDGVIDAEDGVEDGVSDVENLGIEQSVEGGGNGGEGVEGGGNDGEGVEGCENGGEGVEGGGNGGEGVEGGGNGGESVEGGGNGGEGVEGGGNGGEGVEGGGNGGQGVEGGGNGGEGMEGGGNGGQGVEGGGNGGEGVEGGGNGGEGVEGGGNGGEGVEGGGNGRESSKRDIVDLTGNEILTEDKDYMWISDLQLYKNDYEVLHSNQWVNDNIINAAQKLLQRLSNDAIKGWQSPQLCKTQFVPLPPFARFVQILHVSEDHWVTVTNIRPGGTISNDTAFIYDSLLRKGLRMETKKQIASLMRPKAQLLWFELMNIQMQANYNDCGLYAIACATEIVQERDPCKASFVASSMREHIIKCFEDREMKAFPKRRERRVGFGGRVRESLNTNIYCYCRMPNFDKTMAMVRCDTCRGYFHMKCIGVESISTKMWFCKDCIQH